MIKVNILLETFEKYLQLNYDTSEQQSKVRHLPYNKKQTTNNDKGTNRKKLVPCFLFWGKFNFYTTCAEVAVRLLCKLRRSKFDFPLLSKLVRSKISDIPPTWSEVGGENSAQVGQNFFR